MGGDDGRETPILIGSECTQIIACNCSPYLDEGFTSNWLASTIRRTPTTVGTPRCQTGTIICAAGIRAQFSDGTGKITSCRFTSRR
jgi:hypothetical protein